MEFYNPFEKSKLIEDLKHINNEIQPKWGMMTSHHLVEHLADTMAASYGKYALKCYSEEAKLKNLLLFLRSTMPLPRNVKAPVLPSDKLFDLKTKTLEDAKQYLISEMQLFEDYFDKNPDHQHIHPVFGSLNVEDWKIFHKKHFHHHFLQFGLLDF
jgi:hypothetical protein